LAVLYFYKEPRIPIGRKTRGVSDRGLAIYIKKYLLKAKEEELWKLKYFTIAKKLYLIFIKKKSSKRNQNPSRSYYNSIITNNLKFQHKPKISSFKNPHIKIDLLLLLL
jgi:hypothetical protein